MILSGNEYWPIIRNKIAGMKIIFSWPIRPSNSINIEILGKNTKLQNYKF